MTKTFIIPIAHPSWIFRGNWGHSRIQPAFIAKGKEISEKGYTPVDYNLVPDNANLYPSLEDLDEFSKVLSSPVTVDIECAGDYLVCVGVLRLQDYAYVCVRFRSQGGDVYDPSGLHDRTRWLFDLLSSPYIGKVFHNGQAFDIPYLEEQGFVVEGFEEDTMLQAHLTYAELPKKLSFLGLVYNDMPNWKSLVSEEDEEKET
jgi:hypothetical protein